MQNRVFFPQRQLDRWLAEDRVELTQRELLLKAEGRRYRIVDAIRVLREVTDGRDLFSLVGKVKSVSYLTELGAELLGTSMLVGESAYDVVPGFLGVPKGDPPLQRDPTGRTQNDWSLTDEALLARFLAQHLE